MARFDPKGVFRVREWTNATGKLDEESPCSRRNVNDDQPAPAHRDCGTQKGKHDECQVEQQDSFGGNAVEHACGDTIADAYRWR